MNTRRLVGLLLLAAVTSACGPRRVQLPTGDGQPLPDFAAVFLEATRACREVTSLSAELGISGRAGGQKLRGRVAAGIARPANIRLEGTAPFGPPVFILAAQEGRTTLLLPRDNRVLSNAPPAAILESLVGLDLGPRDLLAILTGCVQPDAKAAGGRSFDRGWARIDLDGEGRVFLQRDERQRWQVRAATRRVASGALRLEYEQGTGAMPGAVRIASGEGDAPTSDLRITIGQPDVNVPLGPEVFDVKVPRDAEPISLAELRQAGPMGERR